MSISLSMDSYFGSLTLSFNISSVISETFSPLAIIYENANISSVDDEAI